MQQHQGYAKYLPIIVILLLIYTALLYFGHLKGGTVQAANGTGPGGGGSASYGNKFGDPQTYKCIDGAIVKQAEDGSTTPVEDCKAKQETCYSLQDNVRQEWRASCLYNPPVTSSGGSGGGAGCPTLEQIGINRKSSPQTCKYFNPSIDIFDTSFPTEQIDKYKAAYQNQFIGKPLMGGGVGSAREFDRRINLIVSRSKAIGINPVLLLGYWYSESKFSTYNATSATGADFGCAPRSSSMYGFERQIECSLGQIAGGSQEATCALSRSKSSPACQFEQGRITSNPVIFASDPSVNYTTPVIPISKFDDFVDLYGPRSPQLGDAATNLNCTHTYNDLMEVAVQSGACKTGTNAAGSGALASCKFYRNDQVAGSDKCPASGNFRCEPGLDYKSPLLLSYIQEVSKKTKVPASVLAGLVRVESTVPQVYAAQPKKLSYTISDYTDPDIQAMGNTNNISTDIDATIGGSGKAYCPRSSTGALGLTQVQPPTQVLDQEQQRGGIFDRATANSVAGQNGGLVDIGARFFNKTVGTLSIEDFCDPKKSLYLGAGYILGIKGGGWNPPTDPAQFQQYINSLAASYYGNDGQTATYAGSLWQSVSQCSADNAVLAATTALPPNDTTSTAATQDNRLGTYGVYGLVGLVGLYLVAKLFRATKQAKN